MKWTMVDFNARKSFWSIYKKGTWDKGPIGKLIFIYSMAFYIIVFFWGAYKMYEWLNAKTLEIFEKILKFYDTTIGKSNHDVEEESVVETTTE